MLQDAGLIPVENTMPMGEQIRPGQRPVGVSANIPQAAIDAMLNDDFGSNN